MAVRAIFCRFIIARVYTDRVARHAQMAARDLVEEGIALCRPDGGDMAERPGIRMPASQSWRPRPIALASVLLRIATLELRRAAEQMARSAPG